MLRESRKTPSWPLRIAPLVALFALIAMSCGSGDNTDSAVASLADVEVAEVEVAEAEAPDVEVAEDPESSPDSASATTADEPADGEPATNAATAEEAEKTDEEMALDFVACMRDAGIEMNDPTVNADGSVQLLGPGGAQQLGDPDFQDASEGCVDLIETATFFTEAPDFSEIEDSLLEFAQCLREQGLDVTDPDMSNLTGGPAAIFGAGFDPQDPANDDAIAACQQFLPNAAGG